MHPFRTDPARYVIPLFFVFIIAIGAIAVPSYGISWDEKAMFILGRRVYEYIFDGAPYPPNIAIRFHGAIFEFILYGLPKFYGMYYARHIFILRHFVNYLTFVGGIGAMYLFGKRYFRSAWWGLIAATLLFLSPRQFGHAFVNGRDIPTLSLWALAMVTLLALRDRRTVWMAALHGVTCGLAISMRVASVFIPILAVGLLFFLWIDACRRGQRHATRTLLILSGLVLLFSALGTIAFWPLLWEHPLKNFLEALHNMAFEQNQPGGFYFGARVGGGIWHWIPVWMSITTPWVYTIFFVAGTIMLFLQLLRSPLQILTSDDVPVLLWCFGPVLAIMILRSPIFDEWRHIYFIYPGFLLIACRAMKGLWERIPAYFPRYGHRALATAATLYAMNIGLWMVMNHPFQYVYFSLPSSFVEHRFELDYWGISFKQGMEAVLALDDAPKIPVALLGSAGTDNFNMLTREQRRRILPTAKQERGKYVIDNFRGREYKRILPDVHKVASITVSGMEILAVYRNPDWDQSTFNPDLKFSDELVILAIDNNLMK